MVPACFRIVSNSACTRCGCAGSSMRKLDTKRAGLRPDLGLFPKRDPKTSALRERAKVRTIRLRLPASGKDQEVVASLDNVGACARPSGAFVPLAQYEAVRRRLRRYRCVLSRDFSCGSRSIPSGFRVIGRCEADFRWEALFELGVFVELGAVVEGGEPKLRLRAGSASPFRGSATSRAFRQERAADPHEPVDRLVMAGRS
jgi:hypothetical protein